MGHGKQASAKCNEINRGREEDIGEGYGRNQILSTIAMTTRPVGTLVIMQSIPALNLS